MIHQQTIKESYAQEGIGLHTGNVSTLRLKPAPVNSGIIFQRTDLPNQPTIPADIDFVIGLERGTCIGRDEIQVYSTEHIMAALAGMGIDNVVIELDSNEVPLCDGSAKPFVDLINRAGVQEQSEPRHYISVREPILYEKETVALSVFPSDQFRLSLMMDYQHPALGAQHTTLFTMTEFEKEYAPARTFCFLSEVLQLRGTGFIKGGTLDSAIVVQDIDKSEKQLETIKQLFSQREVYWGENGFLNNASLRFPNELCRHKALDLVGDLYLLGAPLRAHVLAARSGHAANIEMARQIRKQYAKHDAGKKDFDVKAIQDILPHRYPFLLVDKVLEIQPKKRLVAIKNVTINEPFFQGHFPGYPVMPGVLQIEALAQAGGLLALGALDDRRAQVVYFMGINNAKFRRPVQPGDQLRLEVEISRMKGKICRFTGKAFVDKELACEADLLATFSDKR